MIPRQILFAQLIGRLLHYAETQGIPVAIGEGWRSAPEADRLYKLGIGAKNSLHMSRLALDLLGYREIDGVWHFLDRGDEPEYRKLGAYWKTLHVDCAWGGDFKDGSGNPKPDSDHFSLRTEGRA